MRRRRPETALIKNYEVTGEGTVRCKCGYEEKRATGIWENCPNCGLVSWEVVKSEFKKNTCETCGLFHNAIRPCWNCSFSPRQLIPADRTPRWIPASWFSFLTEITTKLQELKWTRTYATGETSFERDWKPTAEIKEEFDKIIGEL